MAEVLLGDLPSLWPRPKRCLFGWPNDIKCRPAGVFNVCKLHTLNVCFGWVFINGSVVSYG
jgi:hypothetical protein